jgi:hypothetical protein
VWKISADPYYGHPANARNKQRTPYKRLYSLGLQNMCNFLFLLLLIGMKVATYLSAYAMNTKKTKGGGENS